MGNTPSISLTPQAGSIRSRTSRRSRTDGADYNRVSQAISFYQTPPGSFDLGRRPISGTSTDIPDYGDLDAGAAVEESDTEPSSSQQPVEEPSKKWKQGVYGLVNVQSGTALDLSGADDKSIIGFPAHSGKNQQWHFEPFGEGYTIRSVSSGRYLTIEDGLIHATPIVANAFPVSWKVQPLTEGAQVVIRILWPTEKFTIAMDSGSSTAGVKVQLEDSTPAEERQHWRLVEQESPAQPSSVETHLALQQQSMTQSEPVETAVVMENPDYITTTRTTTTSTITTVTVVVKTPLHGGHSAVAQV